MRKLGLTSSLILGVIGVAAGVAGSFACSTSGSDASSAEDAINVDSLSQEQLARRALQIMGAEATPPAPGEQKACQNAGCHNINPISLKQWKTEFDAANAMLAGDGTAEAKINKMRQDARNPETVFDPSRISIMAAGVHLGTTAQVDPTRHKRTLAQGKMFDKLFAGKPELYTAFKARMLMPVKAPWPRLTPTQYETILKWFADGMPKLNEVILENPPSTCTESFEGLKAHASAVKSENWSSLNKGRRMPNFACPPDANSATQCFKQQRGGKDIFPTSEADPTTKGWAQDASTVRVLREFKFPNSFWMRTSADGRFVATGGGDIGGAQAVDLKATLDGAPPRDIGLNASYDPDFYPDNSGFMFQGQGPAKYCSQSLLEKASTTLVNFNEPECSNFSSADGLYQTVGQILGDNNLSDRFILISSWKGDSGSYTAEARDTVSRAGKDSNVRIYTAVADGNDGKYKVSDSIKTFDTPYLGDTMMGRSGRIIGSRIAGASGNLGYQIDSILKYNEDGSYGFTPERETLGTVCMQGNKANLSFDERFLVTHHYNEPTDYDAADPQIAKYKALGSADVIIADFVTGKKVKIAKLNPGQFGLYAHFRSDGWAYFLVVDRNVNKYYIVASDWAVRAAEATPTP